MADRDFEKEAVAEDAVRAAYKTWIQTRIETIHRQVTAHDVLRRNGVDLKYGDRHEQISCPFHGVDTKPSARVYPESTRSPSHVWCFVCQEHWDAISLWKKFADHSGSFTGLLRDIEQAYGISVPESPMDHYAEHQEAQADYELEAVLDLIDACNRRLKSVRPAFDMQSFNKLSVALDRVTYQVQERKLALPKAKGVLIKILERTESVLRAAPCSGSDVVDGRCYDARCPQHGV